ncbi:MAG: glutamate racemase [Coriobacteriia bacterium]|nr:glutamate racemase [Coriobacteriia bacterium]
MSILGDDTATNDQPIGIFDSGIGGMTVAREVMQLLPNEKMIYFGDTLRCPYGPRSLAEVRTFAIQIATWLANQGVKMIVIACNTATAAALDVIQEISPVPVIGVIEPGARAAVKATKNKIIGVIGTQATIDSGEYSKRIRRIDPRITVFSTATPRFVEIVEQGLRLDRNPLEEFMAPVSSIYVRPAFQEIARDYLDSLKRCNIDTLVLGCTHYPLIAPMISSIVGSDVQIISSAEETARDVLAILGESGLLASGDEPPTHRFVTTGTDLLDFKMLSSAVLGMPIGATEQVDLADLVALGQTVGLAAAETEDMAMDFPCHAAGSITVLSTPDENSPTGPAADSPAPQTPSPAASAGSNA